MRSALSTQMPRETVPATKVLALDTSTRSGSLALLEGEKLVAELGLLSSDNHAERLLGGIDYLLSGAGWRLEQCGLIAVGIGPGSFTGIRIGVSTALGLAQTVGCPLSAVSGLDALAHAIATLVEGLAPRGLSPPIGIVMDASRGQVYHCEYRVRAGRLRKARKPSLQSPGELGAGFGGRRLVLAGDGAARYSQELGISRSGVRRLIPFDLFLAAAIGRLALARKRSWLDGEYLKAEPLYTRPPDAIAKLGSKRGSAG